MREIELNFKPLMAKMALEDKKSCTSRTQIHGFPGDYFKIWYPKSKKYAVEVTEQTPIPLEPYEWFIIRKIDRQEMLWIACHLYKEEGFNSPIEFIKFVKKTVGLKWENERKLHIHHFQKTTWDYLQKVREDGHFRVTGTFTKGGVLGTWQDLQTEEVKKK